MGNAQHVHLIGICGSGMASVAGLFHQAGWRVTGSDTQCYPPMSTVLEQIHIPVLMGFDAAHVDPRPDLVVIGNVCSANNPEAVAVIERGIPYRAMPHAVAEFFCRDRVPMMITGTHGKTTTSSVTAWLLEAAERNPGFLIGGIPQNFGVNYQLGSGKEFVIEGDEYDTAFFEKTPKFLHYGAQVALLGPVEFDHADIYKDLDAVLAAFRQLVAGLPASALLVACVDNPHVRELITAAQCRVVTYGLRDDGIAQHAPRAATFTAEGCNFEFDGIRFHSPLAGKHNLQNTVGVLALLSTYGVPLQTLVNGLSTFRGVKRRQEVLGTVNNITVIDDFAHHPTAIEETLSALHTKYPQQRLLVAFEPRSNTSGRKIFHQAYLRAFKPAHAVVLAPVHKKDRIPLAEQLDMSALARDLSAQGTAAYYCESTQETLQQLTAHAQSGDVIVIMSNGDFGGLHQQLLTQLRTV